MLEPYSPEMIETARQAEWDDQQAFEVEETLDREKFYCLTMFPYPSGHLHMGHVRVFTLSDVIARYQRLLGKNVLQPMGFDAFGLPAENAAIAHGTHPATWTYERMEQMRAQMKRLGLAYDWRRELMTCEPSYYQFEQWLFLRMYESGLAYRAMATVNWDPVDHTVLANEQVIDGRGWRSGALVETRQIPQWFLKITNYADELLSSLDQLEEWPESVKMMQKNWIGKSEGVMVKFTLEHFEPIEVFTTRVDTLAGVTFLALSFTHPITESIKNSQPEIAEFINRHSSHSTKEADFAKQEKHGIASGLFAINPINGDSIPVWITNYVLSDYGSGAVMGVPAHDKRDFQFAEKYSLPIRAVIEYETLPSTETGTLINSNAFDGLSSEEAKIAILGFLQEQQLGKPHTQYRLRDWGISRQRYWGAPIPIIHCEDCGMVGATDLPVCLPQDPPLHEGHMSLAHAEAFIHTTCPKCQKPAKRETDTFDTFMESSWYYARFCAFDQKQSILDDRAKYWVPVDQYSGGIEHAILHLLYARFIHKVLRDLDFLNSDEPFSRLLSQGMVLKDGTKMSKSKGNIVDPQALIEQFGADTVRTFSMFAAPPEQSLEWSDSGVEGAHRFLKRLWQQAKTHQELHRELSQETLSPAILEAFASPPLATHWNQIHQILKAVQYDYERLQFNTVVSGAMKLLNVLTEIGGDSRVRGNDKGVCGKD